MWANVQYFEGGEKLYKYVVPEELQDTIKRNDFVVVNVPDGNTVAKVVRLSEAKPKFKCKPVLKVVNLD